MGSAAREGARPVVGLVIPALNEAEALPLVLSELPRGCVDRLVVVDNGSSDGTGMRAEEAGAEVVREPRRGYGRACLAGIARLRSPGAGGGPAVPADGIVVFLDADHSDYPEEIELVLEPILAGRADLVIGSRILGGADRSALLPQAWYGNRLACLLMRLLFRARYTDLGPFRAIRAAALERLSMSDPDFGWTVEMQLKARTYGLAVEEVPVRYRRRIGKSKITGTLSGTLGAAWKILGWISLWRMRLWMRPVLERGPGA